MKRTLLLAALVLGSISAAAQRDNTQYVIQFAGVDVGTKTTNAQNACNSDTAIPCVIVFDPTLAKFVQGTMPSKCSQCIWMDYTGKYGGIAGGNLLSRGSTLKCIGDSITYGTGLAGIPASGSPSSTAFCGLIANTLGMQYVNLGMPSKTINEMTATILSEPANSGTKTGGPGFISTVISSSDVFTFLPGSNDYAIHENVVDWSRALAGDVVWLALPASTTLGNKLNASSAGVARAGGSWSIANSECTALWGNFTDTGNCPIAKTTAIGATATATVTGTTVYVGLLQFNANGGTCTISVDGVNYGTFSEQNAGANTTYSPYLVRIPGLPEGKHTVIITTVTVPAGFYLMYVASNGGVSSASGPVVYLGTTARRNDVVTQTGLVGQYQQAIRQIAADLSSDGLNVVLVDTSNVFDGTVVSSTTGDGVHPNQASHQNIANLFLSEMNQGAYPRDRGAAQGVRVNTPRVRYTAPVSVTVANTLTETSLIGAQAGGGGNSGQLATFYRPLLGAYTLTVGKTYRMKVSGFLSDTATPTFTVKFKAGSTVLGTVAPTLASGVTNVGFSAELIFTVQSIGSTGTVVAQGFFEHNSPASRVPIVNTSAITLDMTALQALDITATWGAASPSNTATATNVVIEEL